MKTAIVLVSLFLTAHSFVDTVAQIQDGLHWSGYYSNHFGRKLGRDLEWTTRPNVSSVQKATRYASIVISAPLAIAGIPFQMAFNFLASKMPGSRLRIIQESPTVQLSSQTITVASLNACFMEGLFAPVTGGVVSPFEEAGRHASRIKAVAEWIGTQKIGPGKSSPDVFVGQEFHDLKTIQAFIAEMKQYGYTTFIYDRAPHVLCLTSGLLIASKCKLTEINFTPFLLKDRTGKARAMQLGALSATVLNHHDKPLVRIFNTHLNCGGNEVQFARNNQLKNLLSFLYRNLDLPSSVI